MAFPLDVIIRTRGDTPRFQLLKRAIDSTARQQGIDARCLVIVNGSDYAVDVLRWLRKQSNIVVQKHNEPSKTRALQIGRQLVSAPYFCYLDDDDEFIDNALYRPIALLDKNEKYAVIITTGFFGAEGGEEKKITEIRRHIEDPSVSLLDENWLAPGASFFRRSTVGLETLTSNVEYHEWGHIAVQLCKQSKKLFFMDIPTVIIHNTPGSESKALAHAEEEINFLRAMRRELGLSGPLRRRFMDKYRDAQHRLAWRYCVEGRVRKAFWWHLASLSPPYTWKYLLFSRKLIWPRRKREDVLQ